MKLALCMSCSDFVAPHQQAGTWRWCSCGRMGTRWADAAAGRLLVAHRFHAGNHVRILGLNNLFLTSALEATPGEISGSGWARLHDDVREMTPDRYLFAQRGCWAVMFRPGDTGDVEVVDFRQARAERDEFDLP